MLCKVIAVYCGNYTKGTFVNTLYRKRSEFYNISITNVPFFIKMKLVDRFL